MRPFQIALLAGFGLIALVSLVLLASYQGVGITSQNPYGEKVTIWGTFDQVAFDTVINTIIQSDRDFEVVRYVEKDARTFESELVNAIAEGRGPDAIILSHEDLVTLRPKLQPISYDVVSERNLRDQYADGFEIFARPNGLFALPLFVDPLLMYWSRDLFATGGVALPPNTWESLVNTTDRLTIRDSSRNLQQATIAFGEYENVTNAKSSLLTLLLQSGSQLVQEDQGRYQVALDTALDGSGRKPLNSTLQFFVEFSNVGSPLYSWNRTFESDRKAFVGERLALYFGFGSEAESIRTQNPNLNFDATGVPQGAGDTIKRTYGRFYGVSIVASSPNQSGAYRAAWMISSAPSALALSEALDLAPAHRASLAVTPDSPIRETIYREALTARGWLDPGTEKSSGIFKQLIDDIVSGRSAIGSAAADALSRLELAF